MLDDSIYSSIGGNSLVSAARWVVALPIKAKPSNLPSGDSKRASTPPSTMIVFQWPDAPLAGGETTVGNAGVLTMTGIAG